MVYTSADGAELLLLLAYSPEVLGPVVCQSMLEAVSVPALAVLHG